MAFSGGFDLQSPTRREARTIPANNTEIEKRLWDAADELRANSKLRSQEYSTPVLGLLRGKRPEMPWGGSPFAKAPTEKEPAEQEAML